MLIYALETYLFPHLPKGRFFPSVGLRPNYTLESTPEGPVGSRQGSCFDPVS